MSGWKIEQAGAHEWRVYNGNETHWASTPEDAVRLKRALERPEEESR